MAKLFSPTSPNVEQPQYIRRTIGKSLQRLTTLPAVPHRLYPAKKTRNRVLDADAMIGSSSRSDIGGSDLGSVHHLRHQKFRN